MKKILDKISNIKDKEKGFIALMSVLIISITLLGFSFTKSNNGFFSRFGALEGEYKRIGLGLAESCVNVALLKISQDPSYAPPSGGEVVSVNPSANPPTECIIKSVDYDRGAPYNWSTSPYQEKATIATQAEYKGTWSNMNVAVVVQNPLYAMVVRGTVSVAVNVVNDNGGIKQPADFNITVTPPSLNPSPASFSGTAIGNETIVYVNPTGTTNPYSINSPSPSGYDKSTSPECSGLVDAGENKSCTITYNDVATTGTLTLIAEVINDNGGLLQPNNFILKIDGATVSSGVPKTGLSPGSHALTFSTPSGYKIPTGWGYDCTSSSISLSAGDKKTCILKFDDDDPPALACADSVMILDRTGSLFNAGANDDESSAAIALLDLYAKVTPAPKLGVGSIGAYPNASLPAGAGSVPSSGQLAAVATNNTAYNTLKSLITNMLANSSSVGSNLMVGINAGSAELNTSGRHTLTKEKVLIFVSDGDPTDPTSSTVSSTSFKFPTAEVQNGSGDSWDTATGAFVNGGVDASDNEGERNRFYNFNFPAIPSNAVITGIEAKADAWSTWSGGTSTVTLLTDGFGTGSTDSSFDESPAWTETGSSEKRASGSGGDSPSIDGGRFAVVQNSSSICKTINASGVTALQMFYYWRGDSDANDSGDDGIVEYRTSGNCSDSSGWTQLQNHDLQNDNSWSPQNTFNLPSGLNNSSFLIRFRANSETNEYFRIDGVLITGTGNTTSSGCQIGIDLSWNGGTSWSTEKLQTLTSTQATYNLGSVSDDWASSHTWLPAEFSNTNFRARVRDADGGASCQDTATTHLDYLEINVNYNVPTTPSESALFAADDAKTTGDPGNSANVTQIFSIFFGSDPDGTGPLGKELMAKLASGSVPYVGHQDGSANDQSSTPVAGNTSQLVPSATTTPNQWSTPEKTYVSDNQYATEATNNEQQGYANFNLAIPPSATVTGIDVAIEAKSADSSGCQLGANLSWNTGLSYSSQKTINLTGSDTTTTLGNSSDNWGHTWKNSELLNTNFVLRLQNIDPGSNCTNNSTTSVDLVRVRVYYSTIPENADGDNFFVSPTSNEMTNIFSAIGSKVCPAIDAPPPAPAPTTANIFIITTVINDNGGTLNPDDFSSIITALNPVPSGSPTGASSPGVKITVNPGDYMIDQWSTGGYAKNLGVGCAQFIPPATYLPLTISAGENKTCTIINDDTPPASGTPIVPPPLTNILIGTWAESGTAN